MNTREHFHFLLTKNYGVYTSILIPILFSIRGQSWLGFTMLLSFWVCLMMIYMLLLSFVHGIRDKKVILILIIVSLVALISGGFNLYFLFQ